MQTLLTLLLKIIVSPVRAWFNVHRVFGRLWSRIGVYGRSDEYWKEQRKGLLNIVQASSLNSQHHSVHLNEPGHCAMCGFSTFVLTQPDEICAKCWFARLCRTIDRDYSAAEASRIKAAIRAQVLL